MFVKLTSCFTKQFGAAIFLSSDVFSFIPFILEPVIV